MTLEYQLKKAFLEQEADKYIDYLCELSTKPEVYAAIEKIALIVLFLPLVPTIEIALILS